jgi:hypothetical protein
MSDEELAARLDALMAEEEARTPGGPDVWGDRMIDRVKDDPALAEFFFHRMVARLREQAAPRDLPASQRAALGAMKAARDADRSERTAAFFADLAGRLPAGAAMGEDELRRLLHEHGLTLGPDGKPAIAEDAAG